MDPKGRVSGLIHHSTELGALTMLLDRRPPGSGHERKENSIEQEGGKQKAWKYMGHFLELFGNVPRSIRDCDAVKLIIPFMFPLFYFPRFPVLECYVHYAV